jgi:hypothetical protein
MKLPTPFYVLPLAVLLTFGMGASKCPFGSNDDEESSTQSSSDSGSTDGGGTATDPTVTAIKGTWLSSCASTSNINGAAAWFRRTISFSEDGTFTYIIAYYPNSSCNTTLIWIHSPGTYTVGSATSSPSSGHLLRLTHGSAVAVYTSAAAGATHLNAQCGWGGTFNSPGGLQPGGDWSCNSDSRFTLKGPNTIADLAVVVSGSNLGTTAMTLNMPGVQNGVSVDSVTSLTFTH